ncbi:TIGR03643 family protein [Oligoflexaceae bacterium]|nr:TIGR03643 family protein [Oligoflexaceae bacterium]
MTVEEKSRIIEMAWEDRTPFDAIAEQFDVSEDEVIKIMRSSLKPSSFRLWRKRVSGRSTKHAAKVSHVPVRHRCPSQNKQRNK